MTFKTFAESLVEGINTIIVPLIFAAAFAAFILGIVKYFFIYGSDTSKLAEARQFVLWGLVGFAVAFSVWGILFIMLSTLGILPS